MPPYPRRDYSIPRAAGPYVDTSKFIPFPSIKRAALAIHNVAKRFFPNPNDYSARGGSPTPVGQAVSRTTPAPWGNANWPKDHTTVILPPSPPCGRK